MRRYCDIGLPRSVAKRGLIDVDPAFHAVSDTPGSAGTDGT
jgi:hypothetical protein